jgi:hypothetical protein
MSIASGCQAIPELNPCCSPQPPHRPLAQHYSQAPKFKTMPLNFANHIKPTYSSIVNTNTLRRKNVKKPKKQVLEKKTQKAEQKKT